VPIAQETRQVALLRELDFGSYEGKPFAKPVHEPFKEGKEAYSETHRNNPGRKDVELKEAMKARAERFITEYLVSLFSRASDGCSVVIVSHGIFLTHLWRCILNRFPARNVSIAPGLGLAERGLTLEFLGGWSNTGYLELELRRRASGVQTGSALSAGKVDKSFPENSPGASMVETPVLLDMSLLVKAVNCLKHLKGLKKTGGGIGSSKYDEGQKTIESFFKRRKVS
jgi:Histidine phosphatase superfamily (branch 1)